MPNPSSRPASQPSIWAYPDSRIPSLDLRGFVVEARDAEIGYVERATVEDGGAGYLIINTGPWIQGRQVLLPAGLVESCDEREERLRLRCTMPEIRSAPRRPLGRDREGLRELLEEHYGAVIGGM